MSQADSGDLTAGAAELRQQLLALIAHFDPVKAKREHHQTIGELLTIARGYQHPPSQWKSLILSLSSSLENTPLTVESCAELIKAVSDWRKILRAVPVCPVIEKPPQRNETTFLEQSPPPTPPPPPKSKEWRVAAGEIRGQLMRDAGGCRFQDWILPRLMWRSGWSEAYSVVSAGESEDRAAVVVVPTELAASSRDARNWWRRKVVAAGRLKGNPPGQGAWDKVLQAGPEEEPTFVILEGNVAGETLAEVVERNSVPALCAQVEIAVALCTVLERAGDHGVNLLDLPAEAVRLEWGPGLRMIRLADATSVIPAGHLLPEWRLGGSPPSDTARGVGRSQVFLVAAVLLSCVRGDLRFLRTSEPKVAGRSASLALLAGRPEWCNHKADAITGSLVYELEKRAVGGGVVIRELVEVLRWALAERPEERYASPRELAGLLQKCLR